MRAIVSDFNTMDDLLKRLKLIDNLTTSLQISKAEFVNSLNKITDEGNTGMMSDTFDIFSSSKNEFKGEITPHNFKIKRRRRLFDTNGNFAVANGTFSENNGQLTIETEINGFNNFFIFFYAFLIIFYCIFIFGFLIGEDKEGLIAIPFIIFHALFMFGIPYFLMRRSVKRLKYELEREFFYLTKEQ